MISNELKEKLKERYKILHPLVFSRSCEYATSGGDLFDILETVPPLPFYWDHKKRRWITLEDITTVTIND
jgi:hypothetical protein